MNRRLPMGAILLLGLLSLSASVARAEPPANVQIEVSFLLGYIELSGCEFYRNGSWHDAKTAQAHLRDKYEYLVAGNLIGSTEDFIERAATQSSFSGQAYVVRCKDRAAVATRLWLSDELVRFRTYR